MADFHFCCTECHTQYSEDRSLLVCPDCARHQIPGRPTRGVLEATLDLVPEVWPQEKPANPGFLRAFLPIPEDGPLPPLSVGATPLRPAPRLREALGTPRLWLKDDTLNPSGSTKDRASFLVVAKAMEYGYSTVATASTGNAATALAAVSAAAGTRAVVFVPDSAPRAKLVQMLNYGAEVLPVAGTYDQAFELCVSACEEFGWYNRNTALNPFTVEGKKTAALEIAAAMAPQEPDVIVVPTGDGVILSGLAKGFADLSRGGLLENTPRLLAVQPDGAAAIVHAWREGSNDIRPVPGAESIADSLTVEAPRNAILCLRRIRESGGGAVAVPDRGILESISFLARNSGVFGEPAAAAALAGLKAGLEEGLVGSDERIVLLITGHGLKDVPAASEHVTRPGPIEPHLDAVADRLGI
ncbi:MAG: threonine synthase [Gemmatimonadetes bacterium]|nr:threonine synthase [Gemmatimonadota bacterium]NNM04446.1 threonine synthase [Gemmatimonadota bacterium]